MVALLALAGMFLVICALAALVVLQQRAHDSFVLQLEERHHEERAELLNRIQRPTWTPPPARPRSRDPEEERRRDKAHEVGTVKPLRPLEAVAPAGSDDGKA